VPYKQAAERTRRLQSQGTRPGPANLRRAGELVPAGRVHAFDADTQEVVCGIDAAGLHVFNQDWTSGMALDRCPACLEATGYGRPLDV
jgi:hypothetical protein